MSLDDAINAIGTIGRGLAQTAVRALDDATGMDVGGTLNVLFGNGQETGGQNLATLQSDLPKDWSGNPEQLTALQEGLTQQSQTLSDIGAQLVSVAQSVGAITLRLEQIEQLLGVIQQQQLFHAWQTVDLTISQYLAAISTSFQRYGTYVQMFPNTRGKLVQNLVDEILNSDVGPEVGLTAIHRLILGDGQSQSVLQLWSAMVTPLVLQGVMDYREAVQQYENYYKNLAYAQLCGTTLLMEAYNYVPPGGEASPELATQAYSDYKKALRAQEDTFIQWLVPLVAAGVNGGAIEIGSTRDYFFTFSSIDAAVQLNPGVQHLPSAADTANPGSAFYAPSPVFRKAEELLATLAVTEPGDRRIVVHMLYLSGYGMPSLLNGVQLTLSSTDGQTQVSPTVQTRLGSPYPLAEKDVDAPALPDQNFAGQNPGFYIKRFIFSADAAHDALVDTQYTLTDLNGSEGLVPLATYLSQDGNPNPNPPFMNENVLQHVLQIDAAQPFDFMNFMAYCVPVEAPGANQ